MVRTCWWREGEDIYCVQVVTKLMVFTECRW